ncbi:anosmin-1 isoform X1 [Clarias gariepinus]|uniref:anosmin-1 isoform X1 n=1 Tax=Clarias gariepinus TaxID=13013 RepID=UPI00234C5F77|nr:anosmin-1 isoform X1 [Clarias gariepinus]
MSCASLWTTAAVLVAMVTGAAQGSARRRGESVLVAGVSRARCASRCLSLHLTRITAISTHTQGNGSLVWCQNHKQCSKCLEPCKASWDLSENECQDLCESVFPNKQSECVVSCEFFLSVETVKQGACPAPDRASGFAAACVESCESDDHCSSHKKCCSNGCGRTCQTPRNVYKGVPLKPRSELTFLELSSGRLEIRWSSKFNISAEPVVYVVQQRWNHGIHPSEDEATAWQDVAQVTEERVELPVIRATRWYQFRVAAVNIHGTRGFTAPSKHFRSSRDPSPPPRPSGLRVVNVTMDSGGVVTARLDWTLPEEPDIPVHHYKIFWSWSTAGKNTIPSKKKRRKTMDGAKSSVTLDALAVNSSYTVELQAVSVWGSVRLKSPKATLQFSTAQENEHAKLVSKLSRAFWRSAASSLEAGTPYYQDGQLQLRLYWKNRADPMTSRFHVQWTPELCLDNQSKDAEKSVTHENFIQLAGLLFSCTYRVTVHTLRAKKHSELGTLSFTTPSCPALRSKTHKHIVCPGEKVAVKVLSKPENLTASFTANGHNLTGRFSWRVSRPQPHQPITGLQVTWTDVTVVNRENGLPNSLVSQAQILPPDHNFLEVVNLRPASSYRLEVQVITSAGEGPATMKVFHTPSVTSALHHRPKLHQHSGHQKHSSEKH